MSIEMLPPIPKPPSGIRAARKVAKEEGVSTTTIWRRVRDGLLKQVNINGRAYITLDSLNEFYRRAEAGEFAKDPPGIIAQQKKARAK